MQCRLVGAPVQEGAGRLGCGMAPNALRTAGLHAAIAELGHGVCDPGDVTPPPLRSTPMLKALPEVSAWTESLAEAAHAAADGAMPVFHGDGHSLSAGTVAGLARRAAEAGRPLCLLWLDAHPDFQTLDTTASGKLDGTPVACVVDQSGFEGYYPDLTATVGPQNICVTGLRSVVPAERRALSAAGW